MRPGVGNMLGHVPPPLAMCLDMDGGYPARAFIVDLRAHCKSRNMRAPAPQGTGFSERIVPVD
jgi:hypothetical protein